MRRIPLLLLTLAALTAAAAPSFTQPIACQLGRDCYIQNYVDRDPGPGYRDFACGRLSYDGHAGTDFRLRDLAAMERGVAVLAAADGTVTGVRDGEPDISVNERGRAALEGKDAGNGVKIAHGDGWETQYSHLRRGSVRVRIGQKVRAGEELGLVGLSGRTEFPHVDFAVRKDGKPVDPFAPDAGTACGGASPSLWKTPVAYQASGTLMAGFAPVEPVRAKAEAGDYRQAILPPDAPALVFWVEMFGLRSGDRVVLELHGPDDGLLASSRKDAPRDKAVSFAYTGRKRGTAGWQPGRYRGLFRVERGGTRVIDEHREIEVR